MIAGDFNTNLRASHKHVGARAKPYLSKPHPDTNEMMDLVHDLGLVHLNSWTRHAKATFRSDQGNTLIDHAFARADQCDIESRQAGPVDWPLTRWRLGGRHRPLLFSIPLQRRRYPPRHSAHSARLDKAALLSVCRSPDDPRADAFRQETAAWIAAHPRASIAEVNQFLVQTSLALFPLATARLPGGTLM